MPERETQFSVKGTATRVSGLFMSPANAECVLVFGHGAGAGMKHPFMSAISGGLERLRVATFRYQFPYLESGAKRPDPKPLLLSTVRAAVAQAQDLGNGLPLFLGGKSMGGRMSSIAMAEDPIREILGIVFFGFPLHPPGVPSDSRAEHLSLIDVPMLFLQGTRDKLADLKLLKPVVKKLGTLATIHIIEGADHSFHVPKSSGKSDADVCDNLSEATSSWMSRVMK